MTADPEDQGSKPSDLEAPFAATGLTRRSFLDRLRAVGIGLAAAVTLGVRDSDANKVEAAVPNDAATEEPNTAKTQDEPAETKVDSNDPKEDFAQWYYRRRRRFWRRRRR